MTDWTFHKMHGLGNDFVIVDARTQDCGWTSSLIRAVADRHTGIGFDQLAVITADETVDAAIIYYNADGSVAQACGNATRCIARLLMDESGRDALRFRVGTRELAAFDAGNGLTRVNMGAPLLNWTDIPLAHEVDTESLPLEGNPVATSMGNPHCTFFVPDAEAVDLARWGAETETHPLFPERTNVQFASLLGPDRLRMRVWERGVGITQASGSSSCATAVAAARRGLTGKSVEVVLDGGTLWIDWHDDGVWMTGATAYVFRGALDPAFVAAHQ